MFSKFPRADILFIAPTATYLAYANTHVKFDSHKGMKLAYIDPTSGMHQKYKGGSLVGYEYKRLKISTLKSWQILFMPLRPAASGSAK